MSTRAQSKRKAAKKAAARKRARKQEQHPDGYGVHPDVIREILNESACPNCGPV